MSKKIVIITRSGDITGMIPRLRELLAARGCEVLRFDTDRYPTDAHVAFAQDDRGEAIRFTCGERTVVVGPDDAIWYRRADIAAQLPMSMDPQLRAGCMAEAKAQLRGVLAAAPCFVLDPPDLVRARGHKPAQQRLARAVGLATPRTLMTNDPDEARAFVESCPGGAIAKMMSAFDVRDEQGAEQVVFTTTMTAEHLERLDGLRWSPMVFQEKLVKRLELRVTVVGARMFAAAVDSQAMPGAETDWRARGVSLLQRWRPYELPAEVERALAAYMRAIGMQYSAIDVIVEPDGRHVFLEANPAGECFWLAHNAPHFPLAEALADVLVDAPGARRAAA